MSKIFLITFIFSLSELMDSTCITLSTFDKKYKASHLKNKNLKFYIKDTNKISEGGNGIVYKISWGDEFAALKVFKNELSKETIKEIQILELLKEDENVVKMYECVKHKYEDEDTSKRQLFIIQEFLGNDLNERKFLTDQFPRKRAEFYQKLFAVLNPLHQKGIVHNDIKPTNIMLGQRNKIKLIDFGLSGTIEEPWMLSTGCYQYPGILIDTNLFPQLDIYSMAITIAVLESSFKTICTDFYFQGCDNNRGHSWCFENVRDHVLEIMNKNFGTKKKTNFNYSIDKCNDFGCIIMTCVNTDIEQIPTLLQINNAFKRISNPTKTTKKKINLKVLI